jgi:hypothetical protein
MWRTLLEQELCKIALMKQVFEAELAIPSHLSRVKPLLIHGPNAGVINCKRRRSVEKSDLNQKRKKD